VLRNPDEAVQGAAVALIGQLASAAPDAIPIKEWIRVCFELLDLLSAKRLSIRRAAVATFGSIARAVGPHDVLETLLPNLRTPDRQIRVCTTVAIATVANACGAFSVLPFLLNEYRTPDLNVQNGVLKAVSFLFEHTATQRDAIGDPLDAAAAAAEYDTTPEYAAATVTLVQDALSDRDPVHRQTAAALVAHMAPGLRSAGELSAGVAYHGSMRLLLNHLWPNVLETSPHVIQAVLDGIEGCKLVLGPGELLQYVLPGLFHPAARVRDAYWRIYNMLQLSDADALTPFFPDLSALAPRSDDEDPAVYAREELDLML
jgi:splicing factor 3B subunit 1